MGTDKPNITIEEALVGGVLLVALVVVVDATIQPREAPARSSIRCPRKARDMIAQLGQSTRSIETHPMWMYNTPIEEPLLNPEAVALDVDER